MSKIDSIEFVSKGDKEFFRVVADGKKYSAWPENKEGSAIEAFLQLKNKEIKDGDSVKLHYEESTGTYKGKSIVYKNLTSIEKLSESEKQTEKQDESVGEGSQEMWAAKEKRDLRGRCLFYALTLSEINVKERGATNEETKPSQIIDMAKELENYIYSK